MNTNINITFITPCFCRGADCSDTGEPEIRPASIRGQLHWWFRALGGTPQEENATFGSVQIKPAKASPVVIRVKSALTLQTGTFPTLPHEIEKPDGHPSPKKAIAPGVSFELLISTRLGGLTKDLESKFNRAVNAWLLLGALGLRATRGSGNFTYEGQPQTEDEYQTALEKITKNTNLMVGLSRTNYVDPETARKVITNTLAHGAFIDNKFPLGAVKQGYRDESGAPLRKTSPLRFRIVKLSGKFYIAAIWDGREPVTGNSEADFFGAIDQLLEYPKPIGKILNECFR